LAFLKTIVEASVKVKFPYVYNSTKTYSGHLHTDYEHAQTFFSRGVSVDLAKRDFRIIDFSLRKNERNLRKETELLFRTREYVDNDIKDKQLMKKILNIKMTMNN
jgi:hypothetical protein